LHCLLIDDAYAAQVSSFKTCGQQTNLLVR